MIKEEGIKYLFQINTSITIKSWLKTFAFQAVMKFSSLGMKPLGN